MLIVIIIIGVLAGMMMLSSGAATDRAQQAAAEAAIRTVKSAINLSTVGVDTTGVGIYYNFNGITSTAGTNGKKILDSILEYLQGSNINKIGIYLINTDGTTYYYVLYYPNSDPKDKPYYLYDSMNPGKGVVRIDK